MLESEEIVASVVTDIMSALIEKVEEIEEKRKAQALAAAEWAVSYAIKMMQLEEEKMARNTAKEVEKRVENVEKRAERRLFSSIFKMTLKLKVDHSLSTLFYDLVGGLYHPVPHYYVPPPQYSIFPDYFTIVSRFILLFQKPKIGSLGHLFNRNRSSGHEETGRFMRTCRPNKLKCEKFPNETPLHYPWDM